MSRQSSYLLKQCVSQHMSRGWQDCEFVPLVCVESACHLVKQLDTIAKAE